VQRLSELAYYKTGGTCLELHSPRTLGELSAAMAFIHQRRLPFFILGGGTNSLVLDEHFPGAVISFSGMRRLEIVGTAVHAEAGVDNTILAEACRDHSLQGVAWMNRLPGQVGGTVRMNARCYGGEISQVVERVTSVCPDGTVKEYTDRSVFRGYKDTVFMNNGEVIAQVVIRTQPGERLAIQQDMDRCADDRIAKGQFLHPSCGCVFKNDYAVGVPSGMLLEAAGVKVLSHPLLMINRQHCNFVFNLGATSRDILEFTMLMRESVFQKFGVWLEYEMEILGALPEDLVGRVSENRTQNLHEEALSPLRERMRQRLKAD